MRYFHYIFKTKCMIYIHKIYLMPGWQQGCKLEGSGYKQILPSNEKGASFFDIRIDGHFRLLPYCNPGYQYGHS